MSGPTSLGTWKPSSSAPVLPAACIDCGESLRLRQRIEFLEAEVAMLQDALKGTLDVATAIANHFKGRA